MYAEVPADAFQKKNIALKDLHLLDYHCNGFVSQDNADVWIFNISTLSACSTSVSVLECLLRDN